MMKKHTFLYHVYTYDTKKGPDFNLSLTPTSLFAPKLLAEKYSFLVNEKLQNKRETAKISALPSGKNNKYEYFTGEEILASN